MRFIGIDIGTSSICGTVYHTKHKTVEKTVTGFNDTALESPHIWEKTQDPAEIIAIVQDFLDYLLAKYPNVKGIGFAGQMHGILYTDSEGNAVSPLYTWQDGRGNLPYNGEKSYATYLSEATGYPVASGYGWVTHGYNQANGLIPAGAAKVCTIMDYAVMRFTGQKTPMIDPSNAASLGFFDNERLCFDAEAMAQAGIKPGFLPDLAPASVCAGYYNGIPVYPAIGDNQAAFLGSVRQPDRSVHITVGTSSQLSVYSEKYLNVPPLDTRPLPGGGYLLVGAALCGGQSFRLLKTFFEDTLRFFAREEGLANIDLYRAMTGIAYHSPTPDSLAVQTLFDGSRSEPDKRGVIANISMDNLTPENLILGFLNGICRELYDFYALLPDALRQRKQQLVGSGNGIKKNPLLCQAFEEQFGLPLHLTEHQEEAALGAALRAAAGFLHKP